MAPLSLHAIDKPFISVLMPVYNSERYVADAIRSILAQSFGHFEFIVVDDGSTDNSARVVAEFAGQDIRIRQLLLPHGGVAVALNAGVEVAQGQFIARMDADDIALPERFATQLAWMERTAVDVCGSSVKKFGAEDGILWFPESHTAICHELLFRAGLLHPTVLMQADILKCHRYDEQTAFEDYALWTRLALRYRLGNVPQVLLRYRSHTQQVSRIHDVALRADLNRLRLPYFQALFPEATAEEYSALAGVAEKESFLHLTDLERAGKWLVRLAQTEDNFLRQRMADRWRATCQRSAHLGLECYRLYQQIAAQFEVEETTNSQSLWWLCRLRIGADSRLYIALRIAKHRLYGQSAWRQPPKFAWPRSNPNASA